MGETMLGWGVGGWWWWHWWWGECALQLQKKRVLRNQFQPDLISDFVIHREANESKLQTEINCRCRTAGLWIISFPGFKVCYHALNFEQLLSFYQLPDNTGSVPSRSTGSLQTIAGHIAWSELSQLRQWLNVNVSCCLIQHCTNNSDGVLF